jgi:hypothetical protein
MGIEPVEGIDAHDRAALEQAIVRVAEAVTKAQSAASNTRR